MKVVSAQQMSYLESQAYRDGASESDFMEEAGSGIALVVHDYVEKYPEHRSIIIMCGKGNNAGDGYVAGIHLLNLEYEVLAYQLVPISECSRLCRASYQRFLQSGGRVLQIQSADELTFPDEGVIIDAIFGSGLQGAINEPYQSIIAKINASNLPIISADIPSGLDATTGFAANNAVIATETAFLGLPKTGFFIRDGWDCLGVPRYVDFGLPQLYIEEAEADLIMLTGSELRPLLPRIRRSRHKYQAGSVVGIAGSPTMAGAAILSTSAAMHGGAGIVFLLHPQGMESELSAAAPELIKIPFDYPELDSLVTLCNKASSVFIGPGIGRHPDMERFLELLLPQITAPTVIDADALNLIAGKNFPLPPQCILTPHHGEMSRLLGDKSDGEISLDYLNRCATFAADKKVTLVLKGGPTFIIHSGMPIHVNPRGDPGMATAGSGDVLTGLIAALLAQGATPENAAKLGVYIHGIAGEYAADELTSYCICASDIIYRFTEGFRFEEM